MHQPMNVAQFCAVVSLPIIPSAGAPGNRARVGAAQRGVQIACAPPLLACTHLY